MIRKEKYSTNDSNGLSRLGNGKEFPEMRWGNFFDQTYQVIPITQSNARQREENISYYPFLIRLVRTLICTYASHRMIPYPSFRIYTESEKSAYLRRISSNIISPALVLGTRRIAVPVKPLKSHFPHPPAC